MTKLFFIVIGWVARQIPIIILQALGVLRLTFWVVLCFVKYCSTDVENCLQS